MRIHARDVGDIARVPQLVLALLSEPQDECDARKADVNEVSALKVYSQS